MTKGLLGFNSIPTVFIKERNNAICQSFSPNVKIALSMSSISENRLAESISFMSVTKKELPSNLELMLLSFYLCLAHWLSEGISTSAKIKKIFANVFL